MVGSAYHVMVEDLEGARPVEVIGVADRKRSVDVSGRLDHGLPGAPGFEAIGRGSEALGELIEPLADEVHRKSVADDARYVRLDRVEDLRSNDEDHTGEARADGVEHVVVEHGFSAGTDGLELLQPAEPTGRLP